jgi:hypothetical protein
MMAQDFSGIIPSHLLNIAFGGQSCLLDDIVLGDNDCSPR